MAFHAFVVRAFAGLLCGLAIAGAVHAQTTEFTYQGKLLDDAVALTAEYDFEFRLFAAAAGGVALGTVQRLAVPVTDGIFTLQLDFGAQFTGAARFLEIAVRPGGSGASFSALAARQPITSAPYSIRSLSAATADNATAAANATQLGGVAAAQFVQTADARLTDARNPLPNSANYIQNTASAQSPANFNINGNGTIGGALTATSATIINGLAASVFNSTTQYNIGGSRVFSIAGNVNVFAGVGAGSANTTGQNNAFFGQSAGTANTSGSTNSFFGYKAGTTNTTGLDNAFFGTNAGRLNNGDSNTFVGVSAGFNNSTGGANSFFGYRAGEANTTVNGNSFFGALAGNHNTTGDHNSFFGLNAGNANTGGAFNSFFGEGAGWNSVGANQNAFFGFYAGLNNGGHFNAFFGNYSGAENSGQSNSFFGYTAGQNNSDGSYNAFFGAEAGYNNSTGFGNAFFGRLAGHANTTSSGNAYFGGQAGQAATGSDNTFIGFNAGFANTTGNANTFVGYTAGNANLGGTHNTVIGSDADVASAGLNFATAIGSGSVVNTNNTILLGRANGADNVRIPGLLIATGNLSLFGDANISGGASIDGDVTTGLLRPSYSGGGSSSVCRDALNNLSTCASSLRYKTNVRSFSGGLDIVRRLRPIAFDWKNGGMRDIGFAAEEVRHVEPLLTTVGADGQVEGVKYGQVTAILANAVNAQQAMIEALQRQVATLKALVCGTRRDAQVCDSAE